MELILKLLMAAFGLISVSAAIYNLLTAHRRAKQLHAETQQANKLDACVVLTARNQERITGLENRVGSIDQRIEKRLDQVASDVTKVKDLFTDYLIKH